MSKTNTVATGDHAFEPEFIAALKELFEEKIVFNQALGLRVTSVHPERVSGRIDMRPSLVGHYAYNRIHGGVVSASLDAMAFFQARHH
jgi:acyl-coenzyme A thioesterase PaaI-like protein